MTDLMHRGAGPFAQFRMARNAQVDDFSETCSRQRQLELLHGLSKFLQQDKKHLLPRQFSMIFSGFKSMWWYPCE